MATPPLGSVRRPLRIRRRQDLVCRPQILRGETVWAVKDPVALRYYHLKDEAHWVLEQLDGRASPAEIQERFVARFAPRRLNLPQLQSLVAQLHGDGLVISDVPNQAGELLSRRKSLRRREWWERWSNPLAIRFRGIDPDRLLNLCDPWCRWMFSAWFLVAVTALILAALALVATRFDVVLARLPERDAFLSPANIAWLALTLAGVKLLHELGHALACKHFGGDCHELGLMLLVFTPCLYCNVSDSWLFPDKWQRAAVGAAGIFVELALAAVCTFLWWFSEPGPFNALCLNIMAVCSVSTLLLNGNPLLRYDGYFVLSDVIETPNLSRESARVVRDAIAVWCLGAPVRGDENSSVRLRLGLAAYALASFAYRCTVLAGILWMIYKGLEPYRLESVAGLLAIAIVVGWGAGSIRRSLEFWQDGLWDEQVRPRRAMISLVALLALGVLALAVPLPRTVRAPAVLEPAGTRRVYAGVPGKLLQVLKEGETVKAGDVIATLENSDLRLEIEKLSGERDRQKLRIESLKRRQGKDLQAAAQLPPAEELLADLEERLAKRQIEAERLTLVAPIAGTVLPPRRRPADHPAGQLPFWSGTPLEPENAGCHLEIGTLICLVGDPSRLDAVLAVDQSDVEFVAQGQSVEVQLDQRPGTRLRGTIAQVAEIDLDVTPPELLPGGEVPTHRDEQGQARPVTAFYQARVTLEPHDHRLLLGESGRAKIATAPMSLGMRLWRAFRRTFGIDLQWP
ncbi:MAG: HlyD family efflux transporter periplasmic adaptor subunit [Planctomycetaceae bacterium]